MLYFAGKGLTTLELGALVRMTGNRDEARVSLKMAQEMLSMLRNKKYTMFTYGLWSWCRRVLSSLLFLPPTFRTLEWTHVDNGAIGIGTDMVFDDER